MSLWQRLLIGNLAGFAALVWTLGGPTPLPAAESPGNHQDASTSKAPSILYYASAEGRNLAMDEGILKLRKESGVDVTYVTTDAEFEQHLKTSSWSMVICVDVPAADCPYETHALADYVEEDGWLITIKTGEGENGDLMEMAQFNASPLADSPGVIGPIIRVVPCSIRFFDCRLRCFFSTPGGTLARVECDLACDDDFVDCLEGRQRPAPPQRE